MSPSAVGERLRKAREWVEDLSARELSQLASQSHAVVAHIERGEIQSPRGETLSQIADVLGVDLRWLVNGGGVEPSAEVVNEAVAKARAAASVEPNGNAAA